MSKQLVDRGDVYWLNPNPTVGREIKNNHRFVVISTKEINLLGAVIMVPVTSSGNFARANGVAVPITGHDTTGVALCNLVKSYDLSTRVKNGTARYVETLDQSLVDSIVDRVVSIIDPEE